MRPSASILITLALAPLWVNAAPSAQPKHPRLFFTADDLPAIRQRIKSGIPQKAWGEILSRCEVALEQGSASAALLEDVTRRDTSLRGFASDQVRYTNPLLDLALAWAITDDAKWGDRLRELVAAARLLFSDSRRFAEQAFRPSVTTTAGEGLAVMYDLAYDLFARDDRDWLRRGLVRHCRDANKAMYEGNLGLGEAYVGWQGANLRPVRASDLALPALALMGEVGFDGQWVRTAIAEYESFLSAGLGEEGEYHENGSYFAYGMTYGSRGLYALKRAGHDLFANARLRKCATALMYELTPNGSFNPLNDADYGPVGWHIDAWRMLKWAYPGDPAANWLYREALRFRPVGIGSLTAMAAVLFHRDPWSEDARDYPELRHHARYLPHGGRVYFRTGWRNEDVMACLYSVVTHLGWHGQGDSNSVTLYGHDGRWLIESGYGGELVAPEAHNLVLIDGLGPPSRVYPGSGGAIWSGDGDITQFLETDWASVAEGDARRAYGSTTWYKEGLRTYPHSPVAKALRQVVFMRADAGGKVPGYFLIHDDIQKDKDEHQYEWRGHTPYENRVEVRPSSVLLTNRFNGDYYENGGDPSNRSIEQEFELRGGTDYHVHVVARSPRYTTAYVHASLDGRQIGYSSTSAPFWRPLRVTAKPVKIGAGKHVLSLRQSWSALRVAGVLLVANGGQAQLKDEYDLPDEIFIRLDESANAERPWRRVVAGDSCCEVTFLRPKQVAVSCEDFEGKGLRRAATRSLIKARVRARNPEFTLLAYPHRSHHERPQVSGPDSEHPGYQAQIRWQHATDYVSVFSSAVTRAYEGLAGGTWQPLPTSERPAVDGQLAVVRVFRDTKPDELRFLAISATQLRFGKRTLIDVLDAADYTAVTLVNSGEELSIHGLIRPDSIWQVSRRTRVKVYGPHVKRVLVEGHPTRFERAGGHVIVPIVGRRHLTHKQRVEANIERLLSAPRPARTPTDSRSR